MKKSCLTMSFVAVVFAGIAAISSTGCSKKPETVDYKPMFPEGAMMIGYRDLQAECTNAVANDFYAVVRKKTDQFWTLYEADPEAKAAKKAYDEALATFEKKLGEITGLAKEDCRWLTFSVGNVSLPSGKTGSFSFPDLAVVLYSSKPVDPVAFVEKAREAVCDLAKREFKAQGRDGKDFDGFIANVKEAFSLEKTEWEGRPAIRLVVKDKEIGEEVRNFSPVLAQVGDGRLLVFASNDSSLEDIRAVYSGAATPSAEHSAIVSAFRERNEALAFLAFPKVGEWIAGAIPEKGTVTNDWENIEPVLRGVKGFFAEIGTEGDSVYSDYKIAFDNEKLAKDLASNFLTGKSFVAMMITGSIPEPSFRSCVVKFFDKVSASASGGELRIRIPFSSSLLEELDVPSLVGFVSGEDEDLDDADEDRDDVEID